METAYILRAGAGENISVANSTTTLLLSAQASDRRISVFLHTVPPGFRGPELHCHKETIEMIYVLAGEVLVEMSTEDKPVSLAAGDFVFIPPGIIHKLANHREDLPARWLSIRLPGGFENYFRELAQIEKQDPAAIAPDLTQIWSVVSQYDEFPALECGGDR